MEENIVKTFEDGCVQAFILQKSWNGRTFYRARFRRVYAKKNTGEMAFAYDFDDHHLEALRRVARQSQAWLQEQKANIELTGRQNAA